MISILLQVILMSFVAGLLENDLTHVKNFKVNDEP